MRLSVALGKSGAEPQTVQEEKPELCHTHIMLQHIQIFYFSLPAKSTIHLLQTCLNKFWTPYILNVKWMLLTHTVVVVLKSGLGVMSVMLADTNPLAAHRLCCNTSKHYWC